MSHALESRLKEFTAWCALHIRGDEKGEAQIFLDQLFRAFGHAGFKEAGAQCEERVKKADKGTAFADLVWKPRVLVEMKKRGTPLGKHFRQAFDYWTRLVPGRPRWVVLCNFDEFWVYDFETQMDPPVDRVALADLPTRHAPLAFLLPEEKKPVFGNDQEQVTREAADQLVRLFQSLKERGIDRDLAQRFSLQALMALFAEDIGLLERAFFARLLEDCTSPSAAYDLIGGLFDEMNRPGVTAGGRFKGVGYFNGGLFREPARIELSIDEIGILRGAAKFDWSKVRPEIFGVIFEHSMDAAERHATGAHFTSPVDIMKVVGPTIVEPWTERIEKAGSLKALEALLARLERFHVLDPACGSGNFLYIAYREMKRLEARLYERMAEFKSINPAQRPFGFVTTKNFHGIDLNPFAVELAKVTMMLAHKLAIDELHITENALPLDNLDANFVAGDALLDAEGHWRAWPKADVIVGNPPFLGAKVMKPKLGVDYVNRVRAAYPAVPGMADFCVFWFHRAALHLPPCTAEDPLAGRAGLVGTQNVRNNASREGGLDLICAEGTVVEAVDNQPWSGEANVHVSIANWVRTQEAALLPRQRRLWTLADAPAPRSRGRGAGRADKRVELVLRDVPHLNASLSDRVDLGAARALACSQHPKQVFQGVTPGHDGFVLTAAQKAELEADGRSGEVIHPYLTGRELLTGDATPERWLIDFERRDLLAVQAYPRAFAHVKATVLPDRLKNAEEGKDEHGNVRPHHRQFLDRWWALSWDRKELFVEFEKLNGRFICCARVTKRPIFVFMTTAVRPSDKVQAFLFDDDYSFGVLQSALHWQWFLQKCSKLKSDFSYSTESVYETFPWPQSPSALHVAAVADAARALRALRANALAGTSGGLRGLYRTLELPGKNPLRDAHEALDRAVTAAYGFKAKGDALEQLLALNLDISAREGRGEAVTAPGVPAGFPDPASLRSLDAMGT